MALPSASSTATKAAASAAMITYIRESTSTSVCACTRKNRLSLRQVGRERWEQQSIQHRIPANFAQRWSSRRESSASFTTRTTTLCFRKRCSHWLISRLCRTIRRPARRKRLKGALTHSYSAIRMPRLNSNLRHRFRPASDKELKFERDKVLKNERDKVQLF